MVANLWLTNKQSGQQGKWKSQKRIVKIIQVLIMRKFEEKINGEKKKKINGIFQLGKGEAIGH